MKGPVHIIVTAACALHFVQAACLLADPAAEHVTSIHTIAALIGVPWTIGAFVFVAAMAFASFFFRHTPMRALFLAPQQAVLFVSGLGAISAMHLSHYADGVMRSQAFLVADQVPVVLFALGHAWAIVDIIANER